MRVRRKVTFLAGGAMGATVVYLLDPNEGRGRRIRARERGMAWMRRRRRAARRQERHLAAEEIGAAQRAAHPWPEQVDLDDRTLVDRVESELFAAPSVPKGDVLIDVADSVVTLRGQVEAAMAASLEARVRAIPGVLEVRSLLHPPGTPAPNKAQAEAASRAAER